ncbi:MAG: hypothetical protein ACRC33_09230 [Gemmataceae bacterium]
MSLHGLLDTGAATNILPNTAGLYLGFDWDRQQPLKPIGGVLRGVEVRLVHLAVTVQPFGPIVMPFAWLKNDSAPVLLGQMTFFDEFDVCFFRSRQTFELRRKQP